MQENRRFIQATEITKQTIRMWTCSETSNSQKPGEQGEWDVESEVIQTNDSEKGETDTESEVESDDWIPTKKVKIDSRKRYNHEILLLQVLWIQIWGV